jgi:hypothetical protein
MTKILNQFWFHYKKKRHKMFYIDFRTFFTLIFSLPSVVLSLFPSFFLLHYSLGYVIIERDLTAISLRL